MVIKTEGIDKIFGYFPDYKTDYTKSMELLSIKNQLVMKQVFKQKEMYFFVTKKNKFDNVVLNYCMIVCLL